jgi:hypothetical protein
MFAISDWKQAVFCFISERRRAKLPVTVSIEELSSVKSGFRPAEPDDLPYERLGWDVVRAPVDLEKDDVPLPSIN